MKSAQVWLAEYSVTHQNLVNQRFHMVCVPAIFWSLAAMLWLIPVPFFSGLVPFLNLATLIFVPVWYFYFRLGLKYFIPMLTISLFCCASFDYLVRVQFPLFIFAAIVFVLAWIGQFYGHFREGKKPSFLQDLLFLLIGPIWVLKKIKPN